LYDLYVTDDDTESTTLESESRVFHELKLLLLLRYNHGVTCFFPSKRNL